MIIAVLRVSWQHNRERPELFWNGRYFDYSPNANITVQYPRRSRARQRLPLEEHLHCELEISGRIRLAGNHTEIYPVHGCSWTAKDRRVGQVESFCPELHFEPFRQAKVLE